MLKVVVIDNSPALRRSLSRLLTSVSGVEVAGCAGDVDAAISLIDATSPGVVVLDVNLSDGDKGIDVLRHTRRHWPQVDVIVLSCVSSYRIRESFLKAGAMAFFDKSSEFTEARDLIASLRPPDVAPI